MPLMSVKGPVGNGVVGSEADDAGGLRRSHQLFRKCCQIVKLLLMGGQNYDLGRQFGEKRLESLLSTQNHTREDPFEACLE